MKTGTHTQVPVPMTAGDCPPDSLSHDTFFAVLDIEATPRLECADATEGVIGRVGRGRDLYLPDASFFHRHDFTEVFPRRSAHICILRSLWHTQGNIVV